MVRGRTPRGIKKTAVEHKLHDRLEIVIKTNSPHARGSYEFFVSLVEYVWNINDGQPKTYICMYVHMCVKINGKNINTEFFPHFFRARIIAMSICFGINLLI
jgi:hypothetical protein